jgi:SAM-dependent methyltransferase
MDSFTQLSGFYDLDYPETSDHVFLAQLVRAVEPRHLLEVPCGSGRNVPVLLDAAAGRVTFMDLAETMAREASQRIPARERGRARAIQGDIRCVGATGEFDLVLCPREAFQLLSAADAARALSSLAASVTEDGLVVIDLFRFSREPSSPSDAPPDYFTPGTRGWVEDWTRTSRDARLTVTRRRRQSFTAEGVHFEMRYALASPGVSEPRSVSLAFDMTNYTQDEFGRLASLAHLDVLAAFDGYGGAAAASRSPRTVFVLGHDRCQEAAERVHRIRDVIRAGC